MLHFLPRLLAMPVGTRISKRTKMSECSFDALPREIQLRILREGLITVKDDTHPEPLWYLNPWGPPPAFQIALEGAKSLGDLIKVPKGIVDGLHDVKIAAQVACLSKSMSELTRTGLFEERLAVLEKAVEAEELWTPLEGKNPEYTEPWSPKVNPRGEPWMKTYDDNGKMRKQWLKYIDPRHQDGWTASSTAEKYRALLNHLNKCYRVLPSGEDLALNYAATEMKNMAAALDGEDALALALVFTSGKVARDIRARVSTYDYSAMFVGGSKNVPDRTEQLMGLTGSTG